MKAVLFELMLVCLLGVLFMEANAQPETMGEDEQHLRRRYAESAIASEISKLMDSMVQKNFVDFLLNQNQKSKKSKPAAVEEDAEEPQYSKLLKLSLK